ncbi:MAG: calcium-binding protein [Paracoccaceae bacterium]
MADFIGTPRDDSLSVSGADFANRVIGLEGDDTLNGGTQRDAFFVGPGLDIASGGDGRDDYFYDSSFDSLYIDEFESQTALDQRADRLVLFTLAGVPGGAADLFSLEHVKDAFFVDRGESVDLYTPSPSLVEDNVFIETDTGVIEIFDQYGVSPGEAASDQNDGIELIIYRWIDFTGALHGRTAAISSETEVFAKAQTGNAGNEFFFGTRDDDTIFGEGGTDLIFTGDGDDSVEGGAGVDHIVASRGTNALRGGSDSDWYYWNSAYQAVNRVTEFSIPGEDVLATNFHVSELTGAAVDGDDLVLSQGFARNADQLRTEFTFAAQYRGGGLERLRFDGEWYTPQSRFSGDGTDANDFVVAPASGRERIKAGDGNDAVFAGDARDRVIGQSGDDFLDGGGAKDVVKGGSGDDVLRGGAKGDKLIGGAGFDVLDYRDSGGGVRIDLKKGVARGGDADGDSFRKIEGVVGSSGGDRLAGDAGANRLDGLWGNDVLRGRGGDDTIAGGGRNDRLFGADGEDLLDGEAGADRAKGGDRNDTLLGGAGKDTLFGENGSDELRGGEDNDVLIGGRGRDRMVFDDNSGRDVIRDFEDGRDRIVFESYETTAFSDLSVLQKRGDVVVKHEGGRIVIRDFDEDELTQADFLFPFA